MKPVKHVILMGVDGAGAFFNKTPTPRMDEIFATGATTFNALTSFPSISAECWGSMLHGVSPETHKLTNKIVSDEEFPIDSPYPSVMRLIREQMPDASLASFSNWNPINYGIIEHNLDAQMGTGDDETITKSICDYLNGNTPTMLFSQFDEVDGHGHQYGYGGPEHLASITRADGMIGQVYDTLKAKGILEDTLFIVAADHGGSGHGHGGNTEEEMRIFIGFAGACVKNCTIPDMNVMDIAPTIAAALGLSVPAEWEARVPDCILKK